MRAQIGYSPLAQHLLPWDRLVNDRQWDAIDSRAHNARAFSRWYWTAIDHIVSWLVFVIWPLAWLATMPRSRLPRTRAAFDRFGLAVIRHHYYQPTITPSMLTRRLDADRQLPGIDLRVDDQLRLIAKFHYREELLAFPMEKPDSTSFGYRNGTYEAGDAEILYCMIRHFKPKRIIEVGSGNSTLVALAAIKKNALCERGNECSLVCIEPFEHPWLEATGATIVRKKAEELPKDFYLNLEKNDMLFIDSSHTIRPQADVLFFVQDIVPRLSPGVIVQFHDIFTPKDYPFHFIGNIGYIWGEQYLFEAFMTFNTSFEILLSLNYLAKHHLEKLGEACPVLVEQPASEPGAFWIRRI